MNATIPIAYPKVQFFKPDIRFWDYATCDQVPSLAGRGCEIGQAGLDEDFSAGECDRLRGTPHYFFLVRFNGPIRIWMNAAWADAPLGSTVLWSPGHRHRYGVAPGATIKHSYVIVRGRAVAALLRTLRLPLNEIVAGIPAETFDRHVLAIVQECLRTEAQDVVLENCVANLLYTISADLAALGVHKIDPRLYAVKRTMDLEFYLPHTLSKLAAVAHLSPAYLSHSFKRAFGKAPFEYLIGLRLDHARHLLLTTDMPIKEVCAHVGYEDPYFFLQAIQEARRRQSPYISRKWV